jgi:hypothetical protein
MVTEIASRGLIKPFRILVLKLPSPSYYLFNISKVH